MGKMELLWVLWSETVKGVWMRYFDGLTNMRTGREAEVTFVGMKFGGRRLESKKEVVWKVVGRLKVGKPLNVDGIIGKLKYREVVVEWMLHIMLGGCEYWYTSEGEL